MKEALILVDIQNDYFPDGKFPTDSPIETANECARLLEKFRKEGKEVIHAIHEMTPEMFKRLPFFEKGTPGFEIHDSVKPLPSEKVIVKHHSTSFANTDLDEYLKSKGVDTLIVVGMMIHNCVNATAYYSTDLGYRSIVVPEAVNTFDQKYNGEVIKATDIKKAFLAGIQFAYAEVINMEDIMNNNY